MIGHCDSSLIERDDRSARRFWAILMSMTTGSAMQAGVPTQHLTGSPVLRDPLPVTGSESYVQEP